MSTPTRNKRPALRAVVNHGTRDNPQYVECGAAWPNSRGFNLRLKDEAGNISEVLLFTVNPKPAVAAEGMDNSISGGPR